MWSGYLQLLFPLFFSCSLRAESHFSAAVSSPWFSVLVKQEAAELAANVGPKWKLKSSPLRNFLPVEMKGRGFWPFLFPVP